MISDIDISPPFGTDGATRRALAHRLGATMGFVTSFDRQVRLLEA